MNVPTDKQLTAFCRCLLPPVSGSWAMWILTKDATSSFKVSALTAVSKWHSVTSHKIWMSSTINLFQPATSIHSKCAAQSGLLTICMHKEYNVKKKPEGLYFQKFSVKGSNGDRIIQNWSIQNLQFSLKWGTFQLHTSIWDAVSNFDTSSNTTKWNFL